MKWLFSTRARDHETRECQGRSKCLNGIKLVDSARVAVV